MSSVTVELIFKLQEFLVNAFAAHDLPFCAEHINGMVREQSVDGQPVLETLVVRKKSFKHKIFPLIHQEPSTRIELAFIQWVRKKQLWHEGGVLIGFA
jgi:hypothetical protein